jgi:hypothetical protein
VISALLLLAPVFFIFEIWQLVISERYVGIKQIARGADPRELGLSEITAFFWSATLFSYWIWTLALLAVPFARVHSLCLLGAFALGFSLRRNCRLQWVLVVLTLEGAIRLGFLVSLCALAWRRL